jgi:hypothetical protein
MPQPREQNPWVKVVGTKEKAKEKAQKAKKRATLEERRVLFTRERNGEYANTQDILLAINRTLHKIGGHNMLKLSYTPKGQLSGLLGEFSTSQEVLVHKDALITAARAFDPLIIGV